MDTQRHSRRLFYAIWPDEATRRRISHTASGLLRRGAGRPVPPSNYHLTLAFLGNVESERLAAVEAAGNQCRGRPFGLVLDTVGYWRRSRLLWMGCREAPDALAALVDKLWLGLAPCGFERERRAFHPHVTLARRAAPMHRKADSPPIQWPVSGFSLVESVAGLRCSKYEVLATWPLGVEILAASGRSGSA